MGASPRRRRRARWRWLRAEGWMRCSPTVLDSEATLVVPVISTLEVFKWVLREHCEL